MQAQLAWVQPDRHYQRTSRCSPYPSVSRFATYRRGELFSPRLGIRFDLSGDALQIYRLDGTKFYSYIEINRMPEQESLRAEEATQKLVDMEARLKQSKVISKTDLDSFM
jgi:hypothetical protein